MSTPTIRVIFLDFMGTCLDWHSSAVSSLPPSLPQTIRSDFALEWRQTYFDSNAARLAANQPPEDIDTTLLRTLEMLLATRYAEHAAPFDDAVKQRCVAAWHEMKAWADVKPAIEKLKEKGYELYVFANGTTRLQMDLCRSSGLSFNMCFSSELLGVYKPARESYERVLDLLRVKAQESVMVAAHAYDVRGARELGMRTVYVHRWTDDIKEDMAVVKGENDAFLEDMSRLVEIIEELRD